MKIGIVTIPDLTNLGNRLQNYAMYRLIRQNYQCEVISLSSNREKPYCDGNYKTWLKERIAGFSCIFPSLAEKRFGCNITRWNNFRKWNKLIPSKICYECSVISEETEKEFDYFVAGSDQIWNYKFSSEHFDDYFLRFTKNAKKIAIAASFGVDHLPEEWKDTYKDELIKFKNISVREEAGQAIIRDLLGIDVPVLIDPTMMLTKDEWLSVSRKPRINCSTPYILKYYLGDDTESKEIDTWAKKNGYSVYELLNEDIPELYSAGPGEFISLINNAALVCSDSFHCIVFSIIFSKPFIVYARRGSENYMTSRLDALLKKFGFEDRWSNALCSENYLSCDFSQTEKIIAFEQEKFMQYIKSAIESEK